MSLDLADLLNKYGSDKDSSGYSHVYSIMFDKIKHEKLNVLEIGIGTMIPNVSSSMKGYMPDTYLPGASLRAWNDYFINSAIYGVDIQLDTQINHDRIHTFIADSTNADSVNQLMTKLDVQFDIIIDDGCHNDAAQKKTLANFFPYLKDGGIYIIEDIYPGSTITNNNPYEIKNVIGNYEHFFVGLKNNQCVIRKKSTNATVCC
jgi:hypothetical protein